MVSNMMFRKSMGNVAPVNALSISVGDGKHEPERVSHAGYPGQGPKMGVPECPPLKYSATKGNGKGAGKAKGAGRKAVGRKATEE
jgi:hypothetical protein